MLLNTGTETVPSENGLLTTVCYKIGDQPTVYALEGSIAVTGVAGAVAARQPRADRPRAARSRTLAATVEDNGGCYFVPAFSGLFAPYWRGDARGAIVGLTRFVNKGHIARAALEATAFQTREVIEAMEADSGRRPHRRSRSTAAWSPTRLLMQFQADILGVPVIRPDGRRDHRARCGLRGRARGRLLERRAGRPRQLGRGQALGAADGRRTSASGCTALWKKAVTKTFDWVDDDVS